MRTKMKRNHFSSFFGILGKSSAVKGKKKIMHTKKNSFFFPFFLLPFFAGKNKKNN
jgi:hypothetical protein